MTVRRSSLFILGLLIFVTGIAQGQKKKKNDDDSTQTLPLLKDPPEVVLAETGRLVFHVSPLSAKGLLSQQVRDALKALLHEDRGASIVKLRAFVAGSGDQRRVQAIVSEVFTERKLALPALSTIQVGALPLEGAQVALESVAVDKKTVNPDGLAFFSGQSVERLQSAAAMAGPHPASVLRVTCFLSSLDGVQALRPAIASAFPSAAATFVQLQRESLEPLTECEAVARLEMPPASPLVFTGDARTAMVNAPKLVFSGMQMAFGGQDSDLRLAFERLGKALETLGVGYRDVFWSSVYPLTRQIADRAATLQLEFYNPAHPPAGTLLPFEGLPSLDATLGVDVVAAAPN